eukprot:m.72183 g.72183  ORF g.72183 m.72183 type:complete len:307 (-) comp12978_c0_seq2:63-983(-)
MADQENAVLSRFTRVQKIGEGTFGVVYKAQRTEDGSFVALKEIPLEGMDDSGGVSVSSVREVASLRQLDHVNIVRLLDVLVSPQHLVLVFEFIESDLKHVMEEYPSGLPVPRAKAYLLQLLHAIHFSHVRRIMHRDLKPQNLLISRDGVLKVADFGLSRFSLSRPTQYTVEVVTQWYRAPEVLLSQGKYTAAIDLWSIGCIMAEMLTGRPLFPGDSEIDQQFRIFRTLGTPTETTWPGVGETLTQRGIPRWPPQPIEAAAPAIGAQAGDLLKGLLLYDPSRRVVAAVAVTHPFLADAVVPSTPAVV